MSVHTYYQGARIACLDCGDDEVAFAMHHGIETDSDGTWSIDTLACRCCGVRWKAATPAVLEVDDL